MIRSQKVLSFLCKVMYLEVGSSWQQHLLSLCLLCILISSSNSGVRLSRSQNPRVDYFEFSVYFMQLWRFRELILTLRYPLDIYFCPKSKIRVDSRWQRCSEWHESIDGILEAAGIQPVCKSSNFKFRTHLSTDYNILQKFAFILSFSIQFFVP